MIHSTGDLKPLEALSICSGKKSGARASAAGFLRAEEKKPKDDKGRNSFQQDRNPREHLYAQEGWVDDEVAGVVEYGVGAWGLGVRHQLALARQATPKIELQGLGSKHLGFSVCGMSMICRM